MANQPAPTNRQRATRIERQLRQQFRQSATPLPDAEAALDRLLSGDGAAAVELVKACSGTAGRVVALAYLTGVDGADLRAALEIVEARGEGAAVSRALRNNPLQVRALRARAGV